MFTNTEKENTIIGEAIEETLKDINYTFVVRHDNFSLALFRTVVEITKL